MGVSVCTRSRKPESSSSMFGGRPPAPIISEGDALGLVVFIGTDGSVGAGETEYKLAQAIAGFLGKHMES